MTVRPELTGVPGVAETVILDALVASLPENLSEAPWSCRCEAVVWLGRGGRAARAAFPPALGGGRALVTVGGFVRYQETPVGPYDEVLGMVGGHRGVRPFGSVGFMAVDSAASLVGGRTNWAMPKTLASFSGAIADRATFSGAGDGPVSWRVQATPRVVGPRLPLRARTVARQQFPDGVVRDSVLTASGTFRPAVVRVEVASEGPLASWLRPGRHLGAVVDSMTFTLGEPLVQT